MELNRKVFRIKKGEIKMKCFICGNEIIMNDGIVRISYGRFEGNYNYAEAIFSSEHSKYICKNCAFDRNLTSE